jgi:hypothetical protein
MDKAVTFAAFYRKSLDEIKEYSALPKGISW